MPWGWGKKGAPPPEPAGGSGASRGDAEPPLPSSVLEPTGPPPSGPVRFRIDKVYTIVGLGCVVAGEVVEGILRPPLTMKVVTVSPRPDTPASVQVVMATVHRQTVPEVAPGTGAGLTLRGLWGPGLGLSSVLRKWPVEAGDVLVSE